MVVCVFQVHGATAESFWIWVEDPDNNHIYHSEYFLLHKKQVSLYNNASPKLELIKPPVVALCFLNTFIIMNFALKKKFLEVVEFLWIDIYQFCYRPQALIVKQQLVKLHCDVL